MWQNANLHVWTQAVTTKLPYNHLTDLVTHFFTERVKSGFMFVASAARQARFWLLPKGIFWLSVVQQQL